MYDMSVRCVRKLARISSLGQIDHARFTVLTQTKTGEKSHKSFSLACVTYTQSEVENLMLIYSTNGHEGDVATRP